MTYCKFNSGEVVFIHECGCEECLKEMAIIELWYKKFGEEK